jgi:hypothetical protein
MLITEIMVAMAILMIAILPVGYSYLREARVIRSVYQRAVLMEIVDGEMEILAAGEGRAFAEGAQPYVLRHDLPAGLPAGQFLLTRAGNHLRLEWFSHEKIGVGAIVREATMP